MPKKPVGVTPRPSTRNYVDENLGVYEFDVDNLAPSPDLEGDFHANRSAREGVSGLKAIDTTYENTSEDVVESPRSERDAGDEYATVVRPAPVDVKLGRYPHRRY